MGNYHAIIKITLYTIAHLWMLSYVSIGYSSTPTFSPWPPSITGSQRRHLFVLLVIEAPATSPMLLASVSLSLPPLPDCMLTVITDRIDRCDRQDEAPLPLSLWMMEHIDNEALWHVNRIECVSIGSLAWSSRLKPAGDRPEILFTIEQSQLLL